MRVLGIDPGSRICGYGVLESSNGALTHIESGEIISGSHVSSPSRLRNIYQGLREVIIRCCPDVMSIEDVFFAKNVKSALKLGEARGVALLAAAVSGIPVYDYAPTKVKLALTGSGRARKLEVQAMATRILGITEWKRVDASDAVAIALCHIKFSEAAVRLGSEAINPRRRRYRWTEDDFSPKR